MVKTLLTSILICFVNVFSQAAVKDSLWSTWENITLQDSVRSKALKNYIWDIYLFSKPDSAYNLAKTYYAFAEENGMAKEKADALNIQGISFVFRSDFKSAIKCYNQALSIYQEIEDKIGISNSYNNIGMVYDDQGLGVKAIDYHTRSLKIREEIGYKKGIASSLGNIGNIHRDQGNYIEAIKYLEKSLKMFEEMDNKRSISIALENIGLSYQYKGDFAKAIPYFEKTLKMSKEMGDQYGVAAALVDLSMSYKDMEEYDKSIEANNEALELYHAMGNTQGESIALGNLGSLYFILKKYDTAIEYCERTIKICEEIGVLEQARNAHGTLYNIYSKTKNHQKALKAYENHIAARDSIQNVKAKQEIIRQQYQYEYEKQKALDDVEHDNEIALEKEKQENQYVIILISSSGLFLILILLVIIYRRLKITSRQKVIIEETNEELNQTNEELAAQRDEIEKQKEVVEEAHNEIRDSINYAKRIQTAILPPHRFIKEYLPESFVLYLPKDVVAGDFYWVENIEEYIIFAVADCTGHGVPGALVSVVCHNALNRAVREYGLRKPNEILDKTREIVLEEFSKAEEDLPEGDAGVKDGMDIALCALNGKELFYAGANNPLWIVRGEEIIEIKANRQPIGKFENPQPFVPHKIDIKAGDTLYIFSDGYVDQFGGGKDKKFGFKRLRELLLKIHNEPMQNQKIELYETIKKWISDGKTGQIDDICILGVKL